MQTKIKQAFSAAQKELEQFCTSAHNLQVIEEIGLRIAQTYREQGKVIIFGNGGSMCDAMHFAEELTGRFYKDREPLPAIAISDPSHLTCVANDYGFEEVFSRAVKAHARPSDIVIGLSTSGNSANVSKALEMAQKLGCFTVALLGGSGGKIAGSTDYELIVPATRSDRVQEIHTMILHILVELIETELFELPEPNPIYV
ncbi:MAG: SIS domain-containing protein [Candidatus Cloacimonetes bacterium]|jgi:D-sedoheptulose 7-phosphate isomerase|nr:SIS domain-containing protein [Candidatus Cloacimonadota bacterium]MCK9184168.1 SIS domain-containing protein [Candidatus Cloacimonadota bacterium]MCK9584186.1 SIS domain-containing protein [Candidatus Cloacimonadota bacterium]